MAPNTALVDGDHDTESCCSSVDTNEALLDMLGFSGEFTMEEDEEGPQDIKLPALCSRYHHPPSQCCAFTVSSILSPSECQYLIAKANQTLAGFQYITEASHTTEEGESVMVQLQNPNPHKLSVYQDAEFLNMLWGRLQPHLRANSCTDAFYKRMGCGAPVGLNPRVRVLKYDAENNDRFEPHFDATTRVNDQTSLLTVLIYLNSGKGDDFDGGETLYLDSHVSNLNTVINKNNTASADATTSSCAKVIPMIGNMVVFEHDMYHSGAELEWGTKYVMRTDVMFETKLAGVDSAAASRRRPLKNEFTEEINTNESRQGVGDGDIIRSSMVDFAASANLSEEESDYLNSIGVLHTTPDAFLAPGIPEMRLILSDGGICDGEKIDTLINLAIEAIKNKE